MNEKRDWKKIVADSKGKRIFVPEKFLKQVQECDKLMTAYNDDAVQMGRKKFEMNTAYNVFFLALMGYLAVHGHSGIWAYDIGIDAEAAKEGIFIVNIDVKQPIN